jgi:hypothetical protein
MPLRTKIAGLVLSATLGSVLPLSVTAQTALPAAVTYTATAVHQNPGAPGTVGRITKSGQKMRLEFTQDGRDIIQILRPSEGVMYILDPATRTFFEVRGSAVPATADQGYTTPCPTPPVAMCDRIGDDIISGIRVERWALTDDTQKKPLIVSWDSTRRRALQQEFPDGSKNLLSFVAMEDLNGRQTEHWQIIRTVPEQDPEFGEYWFDPQLRVVTLEILPDGEIRRLDNITVGPVDDAVFQVPVGWQPQIATPEAAPQTPRAAPPASQ